MEKPTISATRLLNDIRSGLSDEALMEKYSIPARGLQYLLKRLTEAGLLTHIELYERTPLSDSNLHMAFSETDHSVLTCHRCGAEIPDDSKACPYCEFLERNFTGTLILDKADLAPEVPLPSDVGLDPDVASAPASQPGSLSGTGATLNHAPIIQPQDSEQNETPEVSALMKAASRGNAEAVEMLLNHGVDVNCRSKYLNTPLMRAVFKGHSDVTRMLLERGADVNAENTQRNTALTLAASLDQPQLTTLLLEHGAYPLAKNVEGNSALILAANEGLTEVAGALIRYGADLDSGNNDGDTALMRASDKGLFDMAALLIESGANVNIGNKFGNTALMKAAYKGHHLVVKILVKAGSDVNAQNAYGNTALMKAAFKGRLLVVRRLLEAGADAQAKDNVGNTALMRAVNGGHSEIVEFLNHFVPEELGNRASR